MKKRMLAVLLVLFILLTGCSAGTAAGQQKIEIDICYTAGGTADTVARQLAAIMSQEMGASFNLVNVTGGSGSIAGQQVEAAPHDGNTWLGDVAHTVSGWRTLGYADLGWEDFYGFYAATSPYVLFVSGKSPYKTAGQLFDAMEADPTMKWGNAGLGSINQLTGQLMLETMGLKGNSVPYDGGRSAAIKVVAGEVVWSWCGLSDIMDLAQSGDVRILGICDSTPRDIDCVKGSYQVPSLLEDYPDLENLQGLLYWGFRVPRDTPAEKVKTIRTAFQAAVKSEAWQQFCQSKGLETAEMTGQESDEMCARLESIYAWGLYDTGISTGNPQDYQIPRIEDFTFSANDRAAGANAWPE